MMISAGIGWAAFPVFIKPLEREFHWTLTQINGGVAVWAAMTGVVSPVLGILIDKFGVRRIMLAGVLMGGICFAALGSIQSLNHLYIVLFFSAIGTAATTYLPVACVIPQWFVAHRGRAMSIAMMGMGVGGFIVPNVSNFLIETVGWRWTWRIFGITIWAVLAPAVGLWIHGSPSDLGLQANGEDAPQQSSDDDSAPDDSSHALTTREAVRTVSFWGIGLADLLNGAALVGITVSMVKFSIDAGIDESVSAFGFSLIQLVMVLGMIVVGATADRLNKRIIISICYGLPALGVLLLFNIKSAAPVFGFSIILGACGAGKAILWPLVVNDRFGKRSFATVMGYLMVFYTMGTMVGPLLVGQIFDKTNSYDLFFMIGVVGFALSGILMAVGARFARE